MIGQAGQGKARGAAKLSGILFLALVLVSCGYRAGAYSNRLPTEVHTIAVPAFVNRTETYRVEQTLTSAVVKEFTTRTQFRILNQASSDADATLHGTVLSTEFAPVTYDSQTGRASSALVTVTISASLVDRSGKVIWQNPNYVFRDQYQVSRELSSFFEEDQPAVDRLACDFARTLVSNIVEEY